MPWPRVAQSKVHTAQTPPSLHRTDPAPTQTRGEAEGPVHGAERLAKKRQRDNGFHSSERPVLGEAALGFGGCGAPVILPLLRSTDSQFEAVAPVRQHVSKLL